MVPFIILTLECGWTLYGKGSIAELIKDTIVEWDRPQYNSGELTIM